MFRAALKNLLAIVAFLFPLAIVLNTKLVPVFLVVVLIGVTWRDWPLRPRFWWPLVVSILAFAVWALSSAIWSFDPIQSLERSFRFWLALCGGLLLCGVAAARDFDNRTTVLRALAIGLLAASLVSLAAGTIGDGVPWPAVGTYIRLMPLLSFGAIAALCVFLLLASLEERPKAPLVYLAVAVAACAIYSYGNSASGVALAAGVCVAALVFWIGRPVVLALAVLMPLFFLVLPVAVQVGDFPARAKEMGWIVDHSAGHRLIVWRYAYSKFLEKPAFGWGLHTSRIMPDKDEIHPADDPAYQDIFEVTTLSRDAKIGVMPMHPHNATLQTMLELGIVGAVLYAMVIGVVMIGLARLALSRTAQAAGAGLAATTFVIGQLSFSAWQSWWLCYQFLAAASFLFIVRKIAAGDARNGPNVAA
jgi:O-antigen ligase